MSPLTRSRFDVHTYPHSQLSIIPENSQKPKTSIRGRIPSTYNKMDPIVKQCSRLPTHESQSRPSSQKNCTFFISLLLSFAFGSVVLLGATLFWHSDVVSVMTTDVHSSTTHYMKLLRSINRVEDCCYRDTGFMAAF